MRRHLHYSPHEVDRMDRLELRMWVEMLTEEFSEDGASGAPSGGGTQSDTKVYDLSGAEPDEATQAEIMQRLGV